MEIRKVCHFLVKKETDTGTKPAFHQIGKDCQVAGAQCCEAGTLHQQAGLCVRRARSPSEGDSPWWRLATFTE